MNQLDTILANKRQELAAWDATTHSLAALRAQAEAQPPPPDFLAALRSAPVGLIAEIKRQSPSAGPIRAGLDAAELAQAYAGAGAQAISVLIDQRFFGGGAADLQAARAAVSVPLLYKEFVVDERQIWHAAACGAAAVLLIAAALSDEALESLMVAAGAARLTPLIEVHTAEEMARVVRLEPPCIGINNRDLTRFVTDLDTTFSLLPQVPAGTLVISESGIRTADDVRRLHAAGVGAILVGEQLLRQPDVGLAIAELMGGVWPCA
jgi:indole-3-glycerol phosphate synthase